MASPNTTYTQVFTTTAQYYRKKALTSNIMKRNALWMKLNEKDRVVKADGGREIVEGLDYVENTTFTRFSNYGIFNIQNSDIASAAAYAWKNAAVNVTFSGQEKRQNKGKEQIINIVTSKVKNGMRTLTNRLSSDLYSDGTADGGLQIGGLQSIVADSGQGTVGGIDASQSANSFWRNIVQSAASPLQGGGAITVSKSTIKSLINPARLTVMQNGGNPDLMVFDLVYYEYLEESFQDLQRYVDQKRTADVGFQVLSYNGMECIFDGGNGIPASHAYMLDTEYLKLVVHEDADMEELETRVSMNQDAETHPIIWMGNLVCSNRQVQAVIKA